VIGLLGDPALRGGKLPSSLLVAGIPWRQSVIGRRMAALPSSAFFDQHRRYSNHRFGSAEATRQG